MLKFYDPRWPTVMITLPIKHPHILRHAGLICIPGSHTWPTCWMDVQAQSFTRPSNDATQLGFFSISSFQILPDLIRVWFINFTMDTMEPMTNSADNANPIQDDLHHRLNFYFETMSKPWTSPLKFTMHTGLMCAQDNSAKEIDICSFIQGNLPESCLCDFAYFNRLQFPPSEDQTKVSPSLHSALTFAARQAGFHLKGNGSSYTKKNLLSRKKFPRGSTSPFGSITYICGRYDRYASQNKDNTHQFTTLDPRAQNFRQVTLHNNQKGNTRGSDGKKGPRKSHSTNLPKPLPLEINASSVSLFSGIP